MRRIKLLWKVLTLSVGVSGFVACAQKIEVPADVQKAFKEKFPSIHKVKWAMESDMEWEAEFKIKETSYSANFIEDGTWMETEHEVKMKEIPESVKATLKREFSDFKVEESEYSETKEESVYEFSLEKGEVKMEVAIDAQGKLVKKEMKEENDDDDSY